MTKHILFIVLIVLWAQFVFGIGMTAWRYALLLAGEYQGYPTYGPRDYDSFIRFGLSKIPPQAQAAYLSPVGDKYTARFAQWHYYLYPRKVIWLGLGLKESDIDLWVPSMLQDMPNILTSEKINAVIAEDLGTQITLAGESFRYDDSRVLIIIRP